MSAPAAEDWWRPFRTIGAIDIVHVDLTLAGPREAEAVAWLSSDEQDQRRNYRHPGPGRRFSLCRAALRVLLTRQLACGNEQLSFCVSPYGKPYALVDEAPAPISFNVSHSGAHGLVAIAPRGRLGVDVEERATRHDLDGPIADVLGPDERKELAAARGYRKLHLFFYYWTIKEALIKALGTGHRIDVSQVQAPSNMRRGESAGIFRFPHLPAIAWGVEDLGNEDFAAAVAYELAPDACAPPDPAR